MHGKRNPFRNKPILYVTVNDEHQLVYDILDGYNWIEGTKEENLAHIKDQFTGVDYYFKRSFKCELKEFMPEGCRLFPLGLNYVVKERFDIHKGLARQFKNILTNKFLPNEMFEGFPVTGKHPKILFRTLLWDPAEVSTDQKKSDRENINKNRAEMIRIARTEFGNDFSGGLIPGTFSLKYAPDLVIKDGQTDRKSYLRSVKEHEICISTTGLHRSIPWKVGEYVAASRAIITEPLFYELPGGFTKGRNYLEYNNTEEFINNIARLREDPSALQEMMIANWRYYHAWLKPESLVLNSLLTVLNGNAVSAGSD